MTKRTITYSEATPEEKAAIDKQFEEQGWNKAIGDAVEQFIRDKYIEEHPGLEHLLAFQRLAGLPPDGDLPARGSPIDKALRVFIALADAVHDLNHNDPARARAASAVIAKMHEATQQNWVKRRSFVTLIARSALMIRNEGYRPVAVAIEFSSIAAIDHDPAFINADCDVIARELTAVAAEERPSQATLTRAAAQISCQAGAWCDGWGSSPNEDAKEEAVNSAASRFKTAVIAAKK